MTLFKRYGPVERVVVRNSTERTWAFITFRESTDAGLAFFHQLKVPYDFISTILPAWTWKQPDAIHSNPSAADDDAQTLLKLNDDCLLHLMKFCNLRDLANLWQTSARLRSLILAYIVPKFDKFEILFRNGQAATSLHQVHTELQAFGPFMKKLRLAEILFPRMRPAMPINDFVYQCNKYIGASLTHLELHAVPFGVIVGRGMRTHVL